jgi:tRNA-splicing ligase RtcB
MKTIQGQNTFIKSWCENPERGAIDQMLNLAKLPFLAGHIAVMPDTHQGYGMPIGGVIATKEVIIPNAVGVDIGCGMCAVKTTLKEINTETLKKIMGEIRQAIPVGFEHQKEKQNESLMPARMDDIDLQSGGTIIGDLCPIVNQQYESALKQIGTLGGGNHFIEIQKGSDGFIWIMIHSGSRNLGKQIADYYNKVAIKLNEKWHTIVDPKWELAFLPADSQEGKAYIREMNYAVDFALANRKLMMDRVCEIFMDNFMSEAIRSDKRMFDPIINIAHNYASLENHNGKNVWIHRKGATLAREETIGIIPGSQGSCSYIVKGKGNKDSYNSCSHGAGRRMGRKEAVRSLDLEAEKKLLDDKGVIHAIRGKDDLEEAPSAYKNIDLVMREQQDLVEILVKLEPLAVIKG